MTKQEYKDRATTNGYTIGAKTDLELLVDYSFHKAACTDFEDESLGSKTQTIFVKGKEDGIIQEILIGIATPQKAYKMRLLLALDDIDLGKTETEIWVNVLLGAPRWSQIHDLDGHLDLSKI